MGDKRIWDKDKISLYLNNIVWENIKKVYGSEMKKKTNIHKGNWE